MTFWAPMSPDLFFLLTLAIKMAVAALFVIIATVSAERAGAVIGALIATLPISAGPAYVFLALDHPPAFIASSALTSLVTNVATGSYALAFVLLAQRFPLVVTMAGSVLIWALVAFSLNSVHLGVLAAALLNVAIFPFLFFAARSYREAEMPRLPLRYSDFILRGALVATLVATVVTLSFHIGPNGTGMLAVFPVLYTSIMVLLFLRVGRHAAAAVIANGFAGLFGFGLALLTLQLTAVPLGSPLALALALAVSIAWNFGLYLIHRRKAAPEAPAT